MSIFSSSQIVRSWPEGNQQILAKRWILEIIRSTDWAVSDLLGVRCPKYQRTITCGMFIAKMLSKWLRYDICDLVGGLSPPLWKILVNWNDDIPNIWKHKTCSKPPTSDCTMIVLNSMNVVTICSQPSEIRTLTFSVGKGYGSRLGNFNSDGYSTNSFPTIHVSCILNVEKSSRLSKILPLSQRLPRHNWCCPEKTHGKRRPQESSGEETTLFFGMLSVY